MVVCLCPFALNITINLFNVWYFVDDPSSGTIRKQQGGGGGGGGRCKTGLDLMWDNMRQQGKLTISPIELKEIRRAARDSKQHPPKKRQHQPVPGGGRRSTGSSSSAGCLLNAVVGPSMVTLVNTTRTFS